MGYPTSTALQRQAALPPEGCCWFTGEGFGLGLGTAVAQRFACICTQTRFQVKGTTMPSSLPAGPGSSDGEWECLVPELPRHLAREKAMLGTGLSLTVLLQKKEQNANLAPLTALESSIKCCKAWTASSYFLFTLRRSAGDTGTQTVPRTPCPLRSFRPCTREGGSGVRALTPALRFWKPPMVVFHSKQWVLPYAGDVPPSEAPL